VDKRPESRTINTTIIHEEKPAVLVWRMRLLVCFLILASFQPAAVAQTSRVVGRPFPEEFVDELAVIQAAVVQRKNCFPGNYFRYGDLVVGPGDCVYKRSLELDRKTPTPPSN
jgi:hypothetical protein